MDNKIILNRVVMPFCCGYLGGLINPGILGVILGFVLYGIYVSIIFNIKEEI